MKYNSLFQSKGPFSAINALDATFQNSRFKMVLVHKM